MADEQEKSRREPPTGTELAVSTALIVLLAGVGIPILLVLLTVWVAIIYRACSTVWGWIV
jgi:hypothetical protein